MDGEGAEAYLRLLAEEELRRPGWPRRVRWAAELLIAMGALDEEVADRIVADFDLAVLVRQEFREPAGRAARLQRWPAGVRFWPAGPASSQPGSGPVPGRVVRLGQVIPLRAEPGGEVYLLSYAQTEPGHQLSLYVRPARQEADPVGSEAGILEQFTATDDRGTRYQMRVSSLGGGGDGWTLLLQPGPPHDPQWLDLVTAPGQPAVRVGLNRPAQPPHDATVTAGPVTASPGDHVLHAVAARLLGGEDPSGFPLRPSTPQPGRPPAPAPRGGATSSRPCRRPARYPGPARCPGSSPCCAPACT
jgi:hypothetical protein